ncbi:MAG: HAD family hydrolase [Cellulomonadaceae bacterium]
MPGSGDGAPVSGRAPVRGVLFDVDDTLVDTRAAFAAALSAVAARFLPHLPAGRHGELLAVWRRDAGGHYRAYTRGETDARTQRMARAAELHEIFGGPLIDDVGFDAWDAVFRTAFADAWRAFDDALVLTAELHERGYPLGALSNAAVEQQVAKLERIGLAARVPLLVDVDTLGVGKPDPRVFLEACRRLGTEPGETLYVGDELDIDARAAAAAGLQGVWLDRPGTRRGGPFVEDPEVARRHGVARVRGLDELGSVVDPVSCGR